MEECSSIRPLHKAILERNLSKCAELLNNGSVDVTAKVAGVTPLHLAVKFADLRFIRVLLKRPDLDVNSVCLEDRRTALMLAAYDGEHSDSEREQIINALCDDPRCNTTQHDADNATALTYASLAGNTAATRASPQPAGVRSTATRNS